MDTPARQDEVMPASISVPADQHVYTHQRPDGRACHSAWAQHRCSCGAYALAWEMTALARSQPPARALDGMLVPGRPDMTFAKSPSILDFVPKNQGIIEILAEAIDGPYRFVHEARHSIYVGVGPSTPDEPIVIHATRRLQLRGNHASRRLQGLNASTTFVIMMEGVDDERLVEVDAKAIAARRQQRLPVDPVQAPLPQSVAIPHAPLKAPPPRLVVAPVTPPAVKGPPPVDAPIPALIAAVCQAEDVHPDLGDYVVIPRTSVPETEMLPRWAVRYDVDRIRIVKPRLGVDRPYGGEDRPHTSEHGETHKST
jgi:hypothetical protein